MPRFERLDRNISLAMAAGTTAASAVPRWADFSPVAYTYQANWFDQLFFNWEFRLVIPCTGNYTFQFSADGVPFNLIYL
jgi:hypothetical protein